MATTQTTQTAQTTQQTGSQFTPVLLVLLALAARLPRKQIVMASILIPLYVLQILLIELPGRLGAIAVSALHPVNAAIMLGLAIVLANRAWKVIRGMR